jgi:hypothetical protein
MFQRASGFVGLWALLAVATSAAMTAVPTYIPGVGLLGEVLLSVGQWAVLAARVPWATRWAVAAAVGGILVTIANGLGAFQWLPGTFSSSPVTLYTILIGLFATTPVVAIMWPTLGARGAAWLLTPPITSLLVFPVFAVPVLQTALFSGGSLEYAGPIVALVRGIVEGCALIWMSRGAVLGALEHEFPRHRQAVRFRDE